MTQSFQYVRSTLLLLWMALTAIFFSFTAWCTLPLPYSVRYWYITRWSHATIAAAKIFCGIDYKIIGKEHLPKTPCIVAINHQSAWETLFLQCLLPPQTWVLKRELLWIPFFGWGLALLRPIAIARQNKVTALKTLVKDSKHRLAQGLWVIIYPEGTRQKPNTLGPFKRSAAKLAHEHQVPLVPIFHNAGTCWPKNSFLKNPGTITIVIGTPLVSKNNKIEELHEELERWFKTQIQRFA